MNYYAVDLYLMDSVCVCLRVCVGVYVYVMHVCCEMLPFFDVRFVVHIV